MNRSTRCTYASTARRAAVVLAIAATTLIGGCNSGPAAIAPASPVPDAAASTTTRSVDGTRAATTVAGTDSVTSTLVATSDTSATDVDDTAALTSSPSPAGSNGSGSAVDPCALLTGTIASAAIGVPVGEPNRVTDQGNASCSYHSADPATNRFVYLTTYAVVGSPEILAAAAATFHDAQPVPGVGDAAVISLQSQAIGVLVGTTVFALGVIQQNDDGSLQLLTQEQLVAVAQAVLSGR